jgi:hypothetical protein
VLYDRPVRELLVQAVAAMPPAFRRNHVVEWFREHYPAVHHATVTTLITAATVNSRSRRHYPGADQHLIFKRSDGLLERYDAHRHGQWTKDGELIPGTALPESAPQQPLEPVRPTTIQPGHAFEQHAKAVCSRHFGVDLKSAVVEIMPGVPHQFDLVSSGGRIVGDAKWLKNIAVPAAKWSVIAEYVWLLQHIATAETRFIVFGQDREVPERWLKRFRPLAVGVQFYFLPENGTGLLTL